jgi:hypothetical protein
MRVCQHVTAEQDLALLQPEQARCQPEQS